MPTRRTGHSHDVQARHGADVSLTDIVKTFTTGRDAVVKAADHVTFTVDPGAAVALTGPSGSGKSTLLHLIGAIDDADRGTITVGGTDVTGLRRGGLPAYRRRVGFIFQCYHLLPALSALDNVIAPVLPVRVDFDRRQRVRDLLDLVGLGNRESALPTQLSGGQQQRVAIARAMISDPPLILADEPTGNLDTTSGAEIVDLLMLLQAERGTTMLIATHDLALAARCDRVIRLRDGQVVGDDIVHPGDPQDVLDRANRLA